MTAGAPVPRHAAVPLQLAVWFGLTGGFAEAALLEFARRAMHRYTHLSPDVAWMGPLSLAAWFTLLALPLLLLAPRVPTPRLIRIAASTFAALAVFDVLMLLTGLHPLARAALALGVGVQLGLIVGPRADGFMRLVRRTLPPLAALAGALLVGMHVARSARERSALGRLPPAPSGAPNVLLVVLDAVRAGELSLHGYARETTPGLARFAARGVVFDRAIATAPWTLPSHASMFTGREARDLPTDWRVPLDDTTATLAEQLARRGYATGGFVGNLEYTTRESGLSRGFARYDDYRHTAGAILFASSLPRWAFTCDAVRRALRWYQSVDRKHDRVVTDAAFEWIRGHGTRPWFAFLNLYDAHHAYLPPAPYDTMFTGARAPWSVRNPSLLHTDSVSPARAQPERDAYDQAIRWQDDGLGAFLFRLDNAGALTNTVVIVTADHGEEFGEHGLLGHGSSLSIASLRVPLVIVYPPGVPSGRRVGTTVSLKEIAATVLDFAGALAALPGTSLRRFWLPAGDSTPSVASAEVRFASGLPGWFPVSRGDMTSTVTDTLQVIRDGRGTEQLINLAVPER